MIRGKVIILIPGDAEPPDGLQDMLSSVTAFAATEVVRSLDGLSRELLLPQATQPRPVVIVLAPTRVDLQGLSEVQELFENTRLILVLSDADEETVALGHRMYPRFVGYLANGFTEIVAVVRKMVGESRSGRSIRERRLRA